ncbi:MAG: phosphotransferase, partial [Actinomycetia bacterium]|nr:phosphotransferase [Actinomycetes bacterium]
GVHGADTGLLEGLGGHATRREHAQANLAVFDGLEDPLVRDAHAWALEHLPPPAPAALIHGDLLGQNILLLFDDDRLGLIDWENAQLGDPAYDLAIVTRGLRRPFKTDDGLARLLDAYAEAGGAPVTAAEVHLWELWLITGWYREALEGAPGHAPSQYLNHLRGILSRARLILNTFQSQVIENKRFADALIPRGTRISMCLVHSCHLLHGLR